jgi:Cell division septal protein
MTEKKRLPQQQGTRKALHVSRASNARSVHQVPGGLQNNKGRDVLAQPASAYHVQSVQRDSGDYNYNGLSKRKSMHGSAVAPRTLQRVVSVPQSADSVAAWGTFEQRQRKRRYARSQSLYDEPLLVPRTFKQTGVRATSGRIPVVRRRLPYNTAPVPVRSGRQRQRRLPILQILLCACGLTIALALGDFFFFSSTFQVQTVNVIGTSNSTLLQDVRHMDIRGRNIFLLNTDSIKGQLAHLPLVSSVTIQKQWPNQLNITITERQPVLRWQTAQGTYSVDQSGIVIAVVTQPAQSKLGTVIERASGGSGQGKTELQIHPGTYLNRTDIAFADDVLQQLPVVTGVNLFTLYYDGTIYASTTGVAGGEDSKGTYSIESPEGWKVLLGSAQDPNSLKNRLQELREVLMLAHTQHIQIATIDLRYGLRPVYTVK